jgi:hypothetical protein
MTLAPDEFIRRFLLHVLPKGFHRIRHYGLLASATCKANIARSSRMAALERCFYAISQACLSAEIGISRRPMEVIILPSIR